MTTAFMLGHSRGTRVYNRGTGPVWLPLGAATAADRKSLASKMHENGMAIPAASYFLAL